MEAFQFHIDAKVGCKDMEGNDVDWFAAIKLPADFDDSKGYSFVYYDSSQPTWKKSKKSINSSNSAIGATISQLYKVDKKSFYIAYNDDGPDTEVESGRGHSKGVAVFDKNVGFWMVHSVPNYPPSSESSCDIARVVIMSSLINH
ncbi:unnamed protein product [Cylicostephanus goldi]|uniref:Uncharacterized protein n=1 Tax=Cylicostephanus goldi TaxID=71465 RepID=A0A3P7MPC3_CYLGO|nr:unnamed protein product [Cylicostephanus goldi]